MIVLLSRLNYDVSYDTARVAWAFWELNIGWGSVLFLKISIRFPIHSVVGNNYLCVQTEEKCGDNGPQSNDEVNLTVLQKFRSTNVNKFSVHLLEATQRKDLQGLMTATYLMGTYLDLCNQLHGTTVLFLFTYCLHWYVIKKTKKNTVISCPVMLRIRKCALNVQ